MTLREWRSNMTRRYIKKLAGKAQNCDSSIVCWLHSVFSINMLRETYSLLVFFFFGNPAADSFN